MRPSGMQAMPAATTRWGGRPVSSLPAKLILPERGGVRPRIERISVVLPAPFEPSRQVMVPGSTVSETSRSTSARS